jgi:glycosyltransferase involved in cell wall biosynthesis
VKIVFLIGELNSHAGQTYNIAEIIKNLLSAHPEWKITVLTPKIYNPLPEGLRDKRVIIEKIDQYYTAMLFRKKLALKLKEYDVIYIKGNYEYVFPAIKSGRPTILVVHQLDHPKLFKKIFPKLKILVAYLMTGYVIKKVDVVVTISEELASFYESKYGINPYIIPDNIPDMFFSVSKRNIPDNSEKIRLLTVGYWDGPKGRKRQDILLKYFADSVKVYPKMHLSMVGLTNDNITQLGKLCNELGLCKNITLKGYLKEKELMDEYLNAHIYVTATTYEGFYRQIVEAFATGMPAVVYDSRDFVNNISSCAAVNHVIKSGAGKLYKDSKSFLESILAVVNNYPEYSIKARKYSLNFSSKVVGPKTEKLIEKLSNGRLNL